MTYNPFWMMTLPLSQTLWICSCLLAVPTPQSETAHRPHGRHANTDANSEVAQTHSGNIVIGGTAAATPSEEHLLSDPPTAFN